MMHSSWESRGPGGGVLGVLAKFFLGSPLFRVLLHFYVTIFRTLPPSPYVYNYETDYKLFISPWLSSLLFLDL